MRVHTLEIVQRLKQINVVESSITFVKYLHIKKKTVMVFKNNQLGFAVSL